jgi:uncharacterized protein (TIGR02300 family)
MPLLPSRAARQSHLESFSMPELGTKHECFSCGARFYDLGRPEAICPKCGANQKDAKKLESQSESSHSRKRRREEVVRVPEEEEESASPSSGDDDFSDEEIEVPEGVDDSEEEEEGDDD